MVAAGITAFQEFTSIIIIINYSGAIVLSEIFRNSVGAAVAWPMAAAVCRV